VSLTHAWPPAGLPQQLGRHALGRGTRAREQPGRAPVPELTLRPWQVRVQRRAHERVHERQRGLRLQDLRAHQRGRGRTGLAELDAGERRRRGQVAAVAEHRHRARHPHRPLRQPREAHENRARGSPRPELGGQLGMSRGGLHALGPQLLEQLVQQQRIAAGRRVARDRERLVGIPPEPLADQPHRRPLAQGAGTDRHRQRVARDLGEQRRVAAPLRRAQAAEHEQRQALQTAHEVRQKAQRRAVAPVKVIDRDH
jgi:hypothetical protein